MDVANLAAQLNAQAILPEGIIIVTLLIILVGDLIGGRSASTQWSPYVAVTGLLGAVAVLALQWDIENPISFLGGFNSDALSTVFRGIIALSTAFTVLISVRYVVQSGTALAEFIVILLTATLGGMFFVRGQTSWSWCSSP